MSKDIYGVPNRHYGSEPDTERDEEAVTEEAVLELMWHGFCPECKATPEIAPSVYTHAETCTPLRERVVARMEADRE